MTVAPEAAPDTEIVQGTITGIIAKGGDKYQVAVQPPGSQYTKNLWTKDAGLVTQLSQMVGSPMAFQCGISHWQAADGSPRRSLWINGVGSAVTPQPAASPPPQPVVGVAPQPMSPQPVPVVVQPQVQPMGAMLPQQPQPQYQPQVQAAPAPQPVPQMQPQPQVAMPQARVYDTEYLRPHSPEVEARIHRQTATKVAALLLQNFPPEERTFDTLLTISERLFAYYASGLQGLQAAPATPPMQGYDGGVSPEYHGGAPVGDDDIPF